MACDQLQVKVINLINYFLNRQFVYFLISGSIAALLHWVSRIILSLWLPFSAAVFLAYFIGIAVAFTLNSYFVFPNSTRSKYNQIRDFIIINLAFLPVVWCSSIVFEFWIRNLGIIDYSKEVAHGCAIALPIVGTFLFYKFVAFRERNNI